MCFVGYRYFSMGITFNGLISGGVAGIFIYFKAGVTLGNNPDPYNKERKNKMKKLKSKKK